MSTQNKMAAYVSAQTADKNESHYKAYPKAVLLSSLKMQVGELLLYLQTPLPQNEQQNYWQVFESCLRRYIDLRFCEGFYE
jgi:hypothetical protein